MSSVLSGSAHLHHRSALPSTATVEKAMSIFRNHDTLIRLDPDLDHYESYTPPEGEAQENTKYYKITDIMHTLPRGLWDTTVSFNAEITDLENGVLWTIRAPMGLVQKSKWTVETANDSDSSGAEKGTLVLVEDVDIQCSRLLLGTVRGKCEENWKGVHARWIEHLNKLETEA